MGNKLQNRDRITVSSRDSRKFISISNYNKFWIAWMPDRDGKRDSKRDGRVCYSAFTRPIRRGRQNVAPAHRRSVTNMRRHKASMSVPRSITKMLRRYGRPQGGCRVVQ